MNYWIDRIGFLYQSTPDGVSLWRYTGDRHDPWAPEKEERWPEPTKTRGWLVAVTSVEAGEYIAREKREAKT